MRSLDKKPLKSLIKLELYINNDSFSSEDQEEKLMMELAMNLVQLKRIYLRSQNFQSGLSFIRYAANIKEVCLGSDDHDMHFNGEDCSAKILDLRSLNADRAKLNFPYKITLIVPDCI